MDPSYIFCVEDYCIALAMQKHLDLTLPTCPYIDPDQPLKAIDIQLSSQRSSSMPELEVDYVEIAPRLRLSSCFSMHIFSTNLPVHVYTSRRPSRGLNSGSFVCILLVT